MSALPRLACTLVLLLAAAQAQAQAITQLSRFQGIPTGLDVPGSAPVAEEPTALSVNPAGIGFVGGVAFQYFHEAGRGGSDFTGNGAWLAVPLGPLVPGLSMEWVSPGEGRGPRYRKTGFGLALAAGQVFSIGWAWNWWSSPDAALDRLFAMDGGFTLRPIRQLSVGASVLGLEGRLAGTPLPVRYDFGAATRILDDSLTLSGDLLANDQGRGDLRVTHGAAGLRLDLPRGFSLQAQYLFPLRSGLAGYEATDGFQVSLFWNQPHVGLSIGTGSIGASGRSDSTNLFGARLSSERYRSVNLVHTVHLLDVADALERPTPLAAILGAEKDPYGALLRRLEEIRDDESIVGLVVKIRSLGLGDARIEELRHVLLQVRDRKPVAAYLVEGETREYLLATAADKVFAPPSSALLVTGLASTNFFLKDGLSKLGVAFEAVAIGRYKTAPEALTRSGMSPAQHEVVTSVLDDRFSRQIRTIAGSRGLPEARVRELVDTGVFTAEEASAAKLLDGALWPDQVEERMRITVGSAVFSRSFDESPPRAAQRWGPRPYIAVMRVDGVIAEGKNRTEPLSGSAIAGSETVSRLIRSLAGDRGCRAIVVRVDSPGGDALASDLIWRELREAREKGKPVVASMGDYAASGGYLVSVAADAIVAEPGTLTGSIGVFALKPDLSGLLAKLGVGVASEQRGEKARIASVLKPWSPAERQTVERQIGAFYEAFLAKVAEGRSMSREEADRLAQGRVWTGEQALSRRLVDRLGSLEDAVALARQLAKAGDDVPARRIEAPRGLVESLASGLDAVASEQSALRALASKLPEVRTASLLAEMGPVLALPPSWALGEASPNPNHP
jgi:protease-4